MKRALPSWMLLLIGGLVVVLVMFWARANPPKLSAEEDPLSAACEAVSVNFGMEIEPLPSGDGGLRVTSIEDGAPAAQAGLQVGDHVVACDERSVWNVSELMQYVTETNSRYGGFTLMVRRGAEYLVIGFGLASSQPDGHDHSGGQA